jgi:hypothetical protein
MKSELLSNAAELGKVLIDDAKRAKLMKGLRILRQPMAVFAAGLIDPKLMPTLKAQHEKQGAEVLALRAQLGAARELYSVTHDEVRRLQARDLTPHCIWCGWDGEPSHDLAELQQQGREHTLECDERPRSGCDCGDDLLQTQLDEVSTLYGAAQKKVAELQARVEVKTDVRCAGCGDVTLRTNGDIVVFPIGDGLFCESCSGSAATERAARKAAERRHEELLGRAVRVEHQYYQQLTESNEKVGELQGDVAHLRWQLGSVQQVAMKLHDELLADIDDGLDDVDAYHAARRCCVDVARDLKQSIISEVGPGSCSLCGAEDEKARFVCSACARHKDLAMDGLREDLQHRDDIIADLRDKVTAREHELHEASAALEEQADIIGELRAKLLQRDDAHRFTKQDLSDKQRLFAQLEADLMKKGRAAIAERDEWKKAAESGVEEGRELAAELLNLRRLLGDYAKQLAPIIARLNHPLMVGSSSLDQLIEIARALTAHAKNNAGLQADNTEGSNPNAN